MGPAAIVPVLFGAVATAIVADSDSPSPPPPPPPPHPRIRPSPSKTFLGKRRLYHATSKVNGDSIKSSGVMRCGEKGMFGAGIYFADSEQLARHKSQFDGNVGDAIVVADVDMGTSLEALRPNSSLNQYYISPHGCQSVHGHVPGRGEEFIVYESSRVTIIDVYYI
jgi:hypothetical protein